MMKTTASREEASKRVIKIPASFIASRKTFTFQSGREESASREVWRNPMAEKLLSECEAINWNAANVCKLANWTVNYSRVRLVSEWLLLLDHLPSYVELVKAFKHFLLRRIHDNLLFEEDKSWQFLISALYGYQDSRWMLNDVSRCAKDGRIVSGFVHY